MKKNLLPSLAPELICSQKLVKKHHPARRNCGASKCSKHHMWLLHIFPYIIHQHIPYITLLHIRLFRKCWHLTGYQNTNLHSAIRTWQSMLSYLWSPRGAQAHHHWASPLPHSWQYHPGHYPNQTSRRTKKWPMANSQHDYWTTWCESVILREKKLFRTIDSGIVISLPVPWNIRVRDTAMTVAMPLAFGSSYSFGKLRLPRPSHVKSKPTSTTSRWHVGLLRFKFQTSRFLWLLSLSNLRFTLAFIYCKTLSGGDFLPCHPTKNFQQR